MSFPVLTYNVFTENFDYDRGGEGPGGMNWVTVTSTTNPNQMITNTGYICNGTDQVILLLPLAPNLYDETIVLSNTATFQIIENGSQQIRFGANATTAGSGAVTSNTIGDKVGFNYVGANLFLGSVLQGTVTLT